MSSLLKVKDLRAYYIHKDRVVRAVDGVSFELLDGDILGVVGESGSGKSSLIKAITANFEPPLKYIDGKVYLQDIDLISLGYKRVRSEIWGKRLTLIPQYAMSALPMIKKIKDIVSDILKDRIGISEKKEIYELAVKRLKELNLSESILEMYPFELSGGMRQRVLIAIATLLNPDILIADEPTSALDVLTQKRVLETLFTLKKRRIVKSILFISHDIALVRQIANKLAVMYAGKIVEKGPTEDVINEPLHPYSKSLVYSILTPESKTIERATSQVIRLKGEPPSLINPPPGCRFNINCPFVTEICKKEEPVLEKISQERYVACHIYANRG
ncbi:MAG: ABC transporter ATP-binding protein [Desulfurococcaceae archaeon]